MGSPSPRSAARSSSANESGVDARNRLHSSRVKSTYGSSSASGASIFSSALALLGARHSDWTAHSRAAEPAVTVRVLREVLLVVVLGVIERGGRRDLGRDVAVIGRMQTVR